MPYCEYNSFDRLSDKFFILNSRRFSVEILLVQINNLKCKDFIS